MTEPDDAELMARIRDGDRDALASLLERHADRIYGFGMRVCRNREDAEEILQETMLAVTRAAGTWRGESAVPTWLFTIARNACARRRRKRSGEPDVIEPLDGAPDAASPHESELCAPEAAVERERMRLSLEGAIDRLPDDMREIIVLRDVEGLSAREVADALEVSIPAVKSRLHRARVRLRESLRPTQTPRPGCPDVVLALSQSLEGELDRGACEELEAHVEGCDVCRARCTGLREVMSMCADSPSEHVPQPVRQAALAAMREALARVEGAI